MNTAVVYAVGWVNRGKRKLSPLTECAVTAEFCYASSNMIEHFHHASVITHIRAVTIKYQDDDWYYNRRQLDKRLCKRKPLDNRPSLQHRPTLYLAFPKSATCHSWQQSAFLFLLKKYSCSLVRFPSAPVLAIDEEEKTERDREKATSTSKRHIQ